MKKSILLFGFCLVACVLNIPAIMDNTNTGTNKTNSGTQLTRQDNTFTTDFENGKDSHWTGRGSALLTVTDLSAYEGKYSLLTTKRTAAWNGPQIELTGKIVQSGTYNVSLWVKLPEGEPDSEMIVSVQRDKNGSSSWDRVLTQIIKANTWVNLSGAYEAKKPFDRIFIYIESTNAGLPYYIDEFSVTLVDMGEEIGKKEINKNIPSLWEVYKDYFPLGAAVELDQLEGQEEELLLKHFSSLTAENIMKPGHISPSENTYNFIQSDKLVEFARKHKKQIRGHTLVWHTQNAKWMFYDTNGKKVSRDVLLKRMEDYIKTIVSRYKGKIFAWDVVNEAIDDSGEGLRNSEWLQIIGEDYIEKAFIYAREADNDVKLILNDYNTADKKKGAAIYNLAKKLKEKKVPLDGVGMQFHISLEYPTIESIDNTLQKFSELDLEIQITELDMSLNKDVNFHPGNLPETLAIRQGYRYKELFDILKKYRNITSVTFWGMHDGHTWLHSFPARKEDWPLLFDSNYREKYAYWGLVNPLKLPKKSENRITGLPDCSEIHPGNTSGFGTLVLSE